MLWGMVPQTTWLSPLHPGLLRDPFMHPSPSHSCYGLNPQGSHKSYQRRIWETLHTWCILKDNSKQVDGAAGAQSQTVSRCIKQQEGNTRRSAGGEGSGRATSLCTLFDINYTCWNPACLHKNHKSVKLQMALV